MKTIAIIVGLMLSITLTCQASYLESWLLEAEILEVLDAEKTAEVLKENEDFRAQGKNQVALKVKLTDCKIVPGSHGEKLCTVGQEMTIILGSDEVLTFKKGDAIKVSYTYVSSRGGGSSHNWKLTEEKPTP